jgi:hypothetical protein
LFDGVAPPHAPENEHLVQATGAQVGGLAGAFGQTLRPVHDAQVVDAVLSKKKEL